MNCYLPDIFTFILFVKSQANNLIKRYFLRFLNPILFPMSMLFQNIQIYCNVAPEIIWKLNARDRKQEKFDIASLAPLGIHCNEQLGLTAASLAKLGIHCNDHLSNTASLAPLGIRCILLLFQAVSLAPLGFHWSGNLKALTCFRWLDCCWWSSSNSTILNIEKHYLGSSFHVKYIPLSCNDKTCVMYFDELFMQPCMLAQEICTNLNYAYMWWLMLFGQKLKTNAGIESQIKRHLEFDRLRFYSNSENYSKSDAAMAS